MPSPVETDSLLFLDETGTGNYFKSKVFEAQQALIRQGKKPTQSTVFGLGGVLFRRTEYFGAFLPAMATLRNKHFGKADFLLHEFDLRAMSKPPFDIMRDDGRWRAFYDDLNALVKKTDFRVIVATVDKIAMAERYTPPNEPYHPYKYTLRVIIERVINEKGFGQTCRIVAENRHHGLNRELREELLDLQFNGSSFDGEPTVGADEIQARIDPTIVFRAKTDTDAGLEIADLAAGPVTRWLHGLKGSNERDVLPIISPKLRRSRDGRVRGYGAVCLPEFPKGCPI